MRMALTGGKPRLVQRYRIWPLWSDNPCDQIEGVGMRRRDFVILRAGAIGGRPSAVRAQQKAMPVHHPARRRAFHILPKTDRRIGCEQSAAGDVWNPAWMSAALWSTG